MGAWGYRHFDNDAALDWLGCFIETPIALVIRGTFNDFLKQRRVEFKVGRFVKAKQKPAVGRKEGHDDVVAAAALLDGLTPYNTDRDVKICLRPNAEEDGLYTLAVRALREAIKDPWINRWELTTEKRNQVANLIVSLKRKARNERGRDKVSGKRRK